MESLEKIYFSMNYYALKTFGRQQYSNAWAAISELVANGFDAGAKDVYLFIDMRNKKKSIIEILDFGEGMNTKDLEEKYAVIGRNRRNDNPDDSATGRKGIGKLAALYLSDEYEIISVQDGSVTAWKVDVRGSHDDDKPCLQRIDPPKTCFDIVSKNLCSTTHGTVIRLLDVDLERVGEQTIAGLQRKLANYFLFNVADHHIHFLLVDSDAKYSDYLEKGLSLFVEIEKQIAFDNMSHIFCSDPAIIDKQSDTFTVSYTDKLNEVHELILEKTILDFPENITVVETGDIIPLSGNIELDGKAKDYSLTGWIGVHSSIDKASARKNDARFLRNRSYNPNQLRIYVRNKLANDTFLSRLDLTGAFTNYLEGEVSFDILDDNDLEDIATTNRQDFSVDDERILLLQKILRGLCRQLLTFRQRLADEVKIKKADTDSNIQSEQKIGFAKAAHTDLLSAGLPSDKADELSIILSNKLEGTCNVKTRYRVFVSHSSKDRIFTDFIVHYLRHRGFCWDIDADKTEIFYSSDGTDITNTAPLADIIKKMIIDANTDILFFTSKNSMQSQYCMFEGGAAWATRAVLDYSIISLDYSCIPAYLTNGKPEFTFSTSDKQSFVLNEQNYFNLVTILNRLIDHLNNNRDKQNRVSLIPSPHFDDAVQRELKGKSIENYMNPEVLQYWKTYVLDHLEEYLT